MKCRKSFKEKFIPSRSRLFIKLFYLCQEDLSVLEYKLKFDNLIFECSFQIDHLPTIYTHTHTQIET